MPEFLIWTPILESEKILTILLKLKLFRLKVRVLKWINCKNPDFSKLSHCIWGCFSDEKRAKIGALCFEKFFWNCVRARISRTFLGGVIVLNLNFRFEKQKNFSFFIIKLRDLARPAFFNNFRRNPQTRMRYVNNCPSWESWRNFSQDFRQKN